MIKIVCNKGITTQRDVNTVALLAGSFIEDEEAEGGGYSTIVVGRRGLSKIEAFFMGRVGHKVVYGGKKFTVWVV